MKKLFCTLYSVLILLGSCSEDNTITPETVSVDFTLQHNEWKTATLSNDIITNQKNISHYEFDVAELSRFITQEEVTYVWFDLGLNNTNQITFTATGVNDNDFIIDQVPSKIITTEKYNTDFNILQQVREAKIDVPTEVTHMLSNKDAYTYLNTMNRSYTHFETKLTYDGERVRRFGLEVPIVQRMLATRNAHTIALFLGENKSQKITTVFMAKDIKGSLLINNSSDINTSGRAFDVTRPCPNECDVVCAEYYDPPHNNQCKKWVPRQ